MKSADRAALADEMERALRRHVIEAWFPRCLDRDRGGYLCDFDRQWRPAGPQERMLEFQARQTRVAARLALAFPQEGDFAEYALHGFRYLRDVMWDAAGGGGWFWLVDSAGRPAAGETKHAHSGSYGVQACALVFEATGDSGALALAEEGLHWFDRHAHDPEHGGFHGWLQRDGTLIREPAQVPPGAGPADPLGHAVGLKDVNVNGDWFEALLDLRRVSSDVLVVERLRELAEVYLSHLTTLSGVVPFAFAPDWAPVPGPEQYGYCFQAAQRMLEAAPLFPGLPLARRAEKVTSHALRDARRRGGGYAFQEVDRPFRWLLTGRLGPRRRAWWVQLEALRALAYFATAPGPRQGNYARLLALHWRYVSAHVFDDRVGGVFGTVTGDLLPWHRPGFPGAARALAKGNVWKDASHDADSLLKAIQLLRSHS